MGPFRHNDTIILIMAQRLRELLKFDYSSSVVEPLKLPFINFIIPLSVFQIISIQNRIPTSRTVG